MASSDCRLRELLDFFADRLKVQQREAGVRHDLIDAVFALGGEDDLVRLLARVHALQAFVGTEDGANLLAGYKRAANILKKEDWHGIEGEIAQHRRGGPAGAGRRSRPRAGDRRQDGRAARKAAFLHARTGRRGADRRARRGRADAPPPRSRPRTSTARWRRSPRLRAPIDAFFDEVTVNDPDPDKRAARLDLLARFRDAVHSVADFSKIEG